MKGSVWWLAHWLGVASVALLVACSDEDNTGATDSGATPYEKLQALEGCGAPVPCGQMLTYAADESVGACILGSLSTAELAQHRVMGSITGDERFLWDLFVATDRSVQVVYRAIYNEPDANWDDPDDYDYTLSNCALRPATYFDDCLATSPIAAGCLDPNAWTEACSPLSEVHCP